MNQRPPDDQLRTRAHKLGLYGLLTYWDELGGQDWVPTLLDKEESERGRRSLERRIRNARMGPTKPLADFDWSWPTEIDREAVLDLFTFQFMTEAANVVLVGPNGVGKSMIAQNLAHQAVLHGYTALFTSASALLNDLAAQDGVMSLERRLKRYSQPQLLVIDEVGYLSYDNRHADLLFEVVNRRYQKLPTVITTNLAFGDWNQVFPSATCVVTLVDRLIHKAEIVSIAGESYRLKEAREREERKANKRRKRADPQADDN